MASGGFCEGWSLGLCNCFVILSEGLPCYNSLDYNAQAAARNQRVKEAGIQEGNGNGRKSRGEKGKWRRPAVDHRRGNRRRGAGRLPGSVRLGPEPGYHPAQCDGGGRGRVQYDPGAGAGGGGRGRPAGGERYLLYPVLSGPEYRAERRGRGPGRGAERQGGLSDRPGELFY